MHIIQLSRGKVLPERKTFDINLCHCQHLHYVTVLVKVKNNPDKKVQIKGLNMSILYRNQFLSRIQESEILLII